MKKLLSLLLVLAMTAALFGCGSSPAKSIVNHSKEELEKYMKLDGLPILKDGQSLSLKVFVSLNANAANPKEMAWTKQIEKATGVEINWIAHSDTIAGEKLRQLILSNDLPDVIFSPVTSYEIVQYMDQGIFRSVDDLVENYMPNLKKVYSARPEYKAAMIAPDGKTYGFPHIEEMNGMTLVPSPIYVYKPWLDALKLQIPQTLDEFRKYLELVRDNDLNGNGIDDEIPFTFQLGGWDSYEGYHQILACFGVNDNYSHLTVTNGKVINTTATNAFKDGISYLYKMYTDGLIDKDSFTSLPSGDPRSRIMKKLNDQTVTVGAAQLFDVMNEIYLNDERASEYIPLPQLTGPNGGKQVIRYNTSELSSQQSVISSACKYPELAARWIDYMYDPEQSVYANWGTLDYVYVKDANGILRWDVDKNGSLNLKQGYNSMAEMRFASTIATGPKAILNEYYDTVVEFPRDAQLILNATRKAGLEETLETAEYLPPVWYTVEEQEAITQYGNYITNLMDSTITHWMVEGGIEAEWDSYQQQLKDANISKLMEVYQAAYERYKKTQSSINK